MEAKRIMLITASLVAIVVMSLVAVSYDAHTRWNNQRETCSYYFEDETGAVRQCAVPAGECTSDGKNLYVTLDAACNDEISSSCPEFTEGDLIRLKYTGSDPDAEIGPGKKLVYTVDAPFDTDNEWQTAAGDAGEYTVVVSVSDGEYETSKEVCFVVVSGNEAPVLELDDVTVDEGETVQLSPRCSDPDGDAVKIYYDGDIDGAVWKTGFADAGNYKVSVTCTDTEGLSDTKVARITVLDVNRAPVLTLRSTEITVEETETVTIKATCEDMEGDTASIRYSGDMNGMTWKTGYTDAGTYDVTVTCFDSDGMSDSADVRVVVENKNRPPTLTAMVVKE